MSYITAKPGQLLPDYANASALRVVIYEHWTASIHAVASIDGENVTLSHSVSSRWKSDTDSGRRYYLQNAAEYLAMGSGTFFHDEGIGEVFYAPTSAELASGHLSEVWAANLTELVSTSGARNVRLHNVAFAHAAVDWASCLPGDCSGQSASFLQTAALHWESSSDIELRNVNVSHVGGYGIWFGPGVKGALLAESRVIDIGAGAVRIGAAMGGVAAEDKLARNVTVVDSVLMDGGHVFREGCGVLMQAAADSSVLNCEISRFHYTGVSVGWTWNYVTTTESNNTIGFNRIHSIGHGDLSDMGCVYHLGMDRGTKIINNICSNVSSYSYGGWGYYTDQASRFVTIRDNVAYNTKCGAFHQHYGLDNIIENNIFYNVNRGNCDGAVRSSAHDNGDEGVRSSFTFRKNIVVWEDGPLFYATTKNGFDNETFADNVYWRSGASSVDITFPCPADDPAEGKTYIATGVQLTSNQSIVSDGGYARLVMQDDGNLCLYATESGDQATWCSGQTRPGQGPFRVAMQGDGNLCVQRSPYNAPETVLWCANSVAYPVGEYFAQLGDNCSFCIYQGAHPDTSRPIWCGSQGPCTRKLGDFPTDCSLASWQAQGQDLRSAMADPMLRDPARGDFSLRAGSPALALGFKQIDTGSVGPRMVVVKRAQTLV